MQTLKVWQFSALILLAYSFGFTIGVQFEQCPHALKNKSCNMTCIVPDVSQIVQIKCNGSLRGSCSVFGCDDMINEGGTKVHLEISSLSYINDSCSWTCIHGSSSTLPENVPIYSGIFSPNLTGQTNADGVKLTAIADCLYPYNPKVDVVYSIQDAGPYESLNAQVDLQISTTPGGCSDAIERRVTAVSDVSAKHEVLAGKSVFFKMKFSQYQSGPVVLTDPAGPYSFKALIPSVDCKLEIRLFGSLPVSLCVPITSIVIIILLILKKEPFFKRFGELTKKKVLIIILFILVAIIIGLCLGLLIEGICDNKYLALGLSFLFAILLAVALILILLYYHKKFESKKDIQDGGAQDGNGSSQNNTGSNTTRTTTERVGSPASTSNVELAANLKSEY